MGGGGALDAGFALLVSVPLLEAADGAAVVTGAVSIEWIE